MDQKTLKTIGAAAVGISAVIFVIAWLGMLVEFAGGFAMFAYRYGFGRLRDNSWRNRFYDCSGFYTALWRPLHF